VQPAPPPGWYRDPRSRYRLRWWDGQAWTNRSALDPAWTPILLWVGFASAAWACASLAAEFTASDVADTPQPDQATWVGVFSWLPAGPIGAAAVARVLTFGLTRRWRSATIAASATLICLSVLLGYVVLPKPP